MAISSSLSWSSRKNGSSQSNGLASVLVPLATLLIGVAATDIYPPAFSGGLIKKPGVGLGHVPIDSYSSPPWGRGRVRGDASQPLPQGGEEYESLRSERTAV